MLAWTAFTAQVLNKANYSSLSIRGTSLGYITIFRIILDILYLYMVQYMGKTMNFKSYHQVIS